MQSRSSSDNEHWKLCPVTTKADGTVHYFCYRTERCCDRGCCYNTNINFKYTHLQTWYFWILLVFICTLFYTCFWYCKKTEESKRKRLRRQLEIQNEGNPPRTNDAIYLVGNVDFKKQESLKKEELQPPPEYHKAVAMPSSSVPIVQIYNKEMYKTQSDVSATSTSNIVPPSYEEINEINIQKNCEKHL